MSASLRGSCLLLPLIQQTSIPELQISLVVLQHLASLPELQLQVHTLAAYADLDWT